MRIPEHNIHFPHSIDVCIHSQTHVSPCNIKFIKHSIGRECSLTHDTGDAGETKLTYIFSKLTQYRCSLSTF